MRKRIYHFHTHAHLYKYNFIGMFPVLFNIQWNRKNHYFCSQFVNDILEYGNIHLFDKPSVLITPADFKNNKQLSLVYEGLLSNYLLNIEEKYVENKMNSLNNSYKLVQ